MNLLTEAWIPIRRRDGRRDWVSPLQISDPDILVLDADRPDFNGALAQFLIGLLQTTTTVNDQDDWYELFVAPPAQQELATWFSPVSAAFEFFGDGARFMQDFSLSSEGVEANSISALFIEMPGDNALRNNSDHFIKRGQLNALCPHCAATALFTLQTNAPAGGVGHRTGLRGGGPLTTLLQAEPGSSLWQNCWLNVLPRRDFLERVNCDREKTKLAARFPWLADLSFTQNVTGETQPMQVHPDQIFWAMPRRIRLLTDELTSGTCSLCGKAAEQRITHYVTRNYGLNYKGPWQHPLSPYYQTKEEWLPLHPQPGGLGYRHWMAWVLGKLEGKSLKKPALILSNKLNQRDSKEYLPSPLRLWVFGYDMDNMKARCWYESSLPLYDLAKCDTVARGHIQTHLGRLIDAAEQVISVLRKAVKEAWFDVDPKGDFSAVDAAFWSRTEAAFYQELQRVITQFSAADAETDPVQTEHLKAWRKVLQETADALFEQEFVGAGPIERQKPRRIAEAYKTLRNMLGDNSKLWLSLGLESEKPKKESQKRKEKKA